MLKKRKKIVLNQEKKSTSEKSANRNLEYKMLFEIVDGKQKNKIAQKEA